MYPCKLGPSGSGTTPSSDGARPFAKLIDFEPGLDVRPHAYDGWSAMAVIRGSLDLDGASLAARTSILLPPNTQHSYRVPSGGAQVMQFFETDRGAIPRFLDAGTDVFALAG